MPGVCAVCGKQAKLRCSRCNEFGVTVHYCSAPCQRGAWSTHKLVCGERSVGDGVCQRCLKPSGDDAPCRVPHPEHLLQDAGGHSGGGGMTWMKVCGACGQGFSLITPFDGEQRHGSGPRWCYDGAHATQPLAAADERRVLPHFESIKAGDGMQAEVDALCGGKTRSLVVTMSGFYDESLQLSLAHALPYLTQLKLIDVSVKKLHLTAALTPKLRVLEAQNLPGECDVNIVLPTLQDLTLHYYHPHDDGAALQAALNAAAQLRRVDCYKLWVQELTLASVQLQYVRLHRSDALHRLHVYSPRLRTLDLTGCFALDDVRLLEQHPSGAELPPGFAVAPGKVAVNLENASITDRGKRQLAAYSRGVALLNESDDF